VLSTATDLLTQALLVTALCAVLFWGVVGAALASRGGRSVVAGALLSGLLPLVGWALVLALPARGGRRARRRSAVAAPSLGAAVPSRVPDLTGDWSPESLPPDDWRSGTSVHHLPPPSTDRDWDAPGGSVLLPLPDASPRHDSVLDVVLDRHRGAAYVAVRLLVVPGAAAVVLLLASLRRPWVDVQAQGFVDESYAGTSTVWTAVPLVVSCVLLAVTVAAFTWRPAGRWAVAAAAVSTVWLLVALELLLVTGAAETLVRRSAPIVQDRGSVSTGSGAGTLALASSLGCAWSVAAVAVVAWLRRAGHEETPGRAGW
jgi:hypothetical protein